ncbi:MAG: T9SS type A sorting domain-containing protein, partial [Saprospiraceae bacterium]|nr:T9SS type A sorting domain-containing protein [Saprospiraceae bacterium]
TSGLNMCGVGTVDRTWTAVDLSGLTASCLQQITIVDTTASVFTPVADITVYCPVDLDTLSTGVPTVMADCELWGRSVKDSVFTSGCDQKIFRTYTFLEWCSLEDTSFSQVITVIDTAPPTWLSPIGGLDTMLECAGQVNALVPQAEDFCNSFTVTEVYNDSIPGSCPNDYQLIRGYIAEDVCGNVSDTFFVNVTILDTIPPVVLNMPSDTFIECGETFMVPVLMAEDNCGAQFTSDAPVVDTLPGVCPILETYHYRWILVDDCNNRDTVFWNVDLIDITAPTALPIPDSTYACLDDVPAPDTAVVMGEMDNCGGPVLVTYLRDEIQNTCEDTLFRYYTIADECDNAVAVVQRYFIADRLPPRVQSCPGTRIDTIVTDPGICESFIDNLTATYLDNCSGPIAISNDSPYADNPDSGDASGTYPLGNHIFRFYGVDTCGNVNDLCIVNLTVTEIEPPTLNCVSGDISLPLDATGNAILDSAMVVLSAPVDDCSSVTLSIVPNSFNCDSLLAGAIKQVFVFASDTFGNTATCGPLTVVLSDPGQVCNNPFGPPGNLGGFVKTSRGDVLKHTMLHLTGDKSKSIMVDQDGNYEFDGLEAGDNISISAVNNENPLNGVTTFDIVLAAKHILGKKRLETPESMIAADVNRSGSITVTDIVELRKMILGKQIGFSHNNSWRIWDAKHVFTDPDNPFATPLPETIDMTNLAYSYYDLDFVAVKVGDVNGDYRNEPLSGMAGNRSVEQIDIKYLIEEKGDYLVSFHLPGTIEASGVQFAFDFDSKALDLREVIPTDAVDVDENFNLKDYQNGTIQFSWNGDLEKGSKLFDLRFRKLKEIEPSQLVKLNDGALKPEFYTRDLWTYNLAFHQNGEFSERMSKMYLQVQQNEPNPFHDNTQVRLHAQESMEVQMEVFNVEGKIMVSEIMHLESGSHSISIEGNRLSGSGVYGCRFRTPHGIQTIKMIYIE